MLTVETNKFYNFYIKITGYKISKEGWEKKMSKKKFKMPSALILLFIVLVFVAILTWFIPTSVMTTDEKTGGKCNLL